MSIAASITDAPSRSETPIALTPADLAEMLAVFNDSATKLQATHESLQAEVARLQRELKTANDELQRSKRLAALGEMAAGISHEVRNPLGSIRLHARMLEHDLAHMPEQRSLAEKILSAVRGLDGVVGDVLAFSKEMTVRCQPVETAALLSRAVNECIASLDTERLHDLESSRIALPPLEVVVTPTESELPQYLSCDPGLVHRALTNVIQNAIQAMTPELPVSKRKTCAIPARRALTVAASSRRVMGSDGGERTMVALTVRDTGPGIGEDVMQRMFNPFFTTRATGTGLGLAIVHRIVDAHGGIVRVRNHEQGGAVVDLMFPASEPQSLQHSQPLKSPLSIVTTTGGTALASLRD